MLVTLFPLMAGLGLPAGLGGPGDRGGQAKQAGSTAMIERASRSARAGAESLSLDRELQEPVTGHLRASRDGASASPGFETCSRTQPRWISATAKASATESDLDRSSRPGRGGAELPSRDGR